MKFNPDIEIKTPHKGACHCGSVKFEAALIDGVSTARRCNCSICRMRGAVAVSALIEDFRILEGADTLSLYQFNTMEAEHYFCSVCGIYTHHKRRSKPTEYGINVACLEGVSPFDFYEIEIGDGVNHPRDVGQSRLFGVLTVRRTDPA